MPRKCTFVVGTALACLLASGSLANATEIPANSEDQSSTEQDTGQDNSNDQAGLINLGDLNLLNGLNVCPDVTALLPIGNLLGILGGGSATATEPGDSTIVCATAVTGKHVGDGDPSGSTASSSAADTAGGSAGPG